MSELVARLYELQKLDSGLQQRRQWLQELDDGTKAKLKLAHAQQALENRQNALKELEATYRRKELELQSADAERQERSRKAYGGTVGDAKELAALEKKIGELKRRGSVLEDELLTLMDQIEANREDVAKHEALAHKLSALVKQLQTDYAAARDKFTSEMQTLQKQRDTGAAEIDASILQEYEAMRAKLDGLAVAVIDGDLCTGCRNIVPSAMISRVRAGKELVKCQNCRRILHLAS